MDTLSKELDAAREVAGIPNALHRSAGYCGQQESALPRRSRWAARGGQGGPFYSWRIHNNAIDIDIMNKADAHATMPNVLVRLGSLMLMHRGLRAVWAETKDCLSALGAEIVEVMLSRVDPAADLGGVSIALFTRPFRAKHYICTRAEDRQLQGGRL